MRLKATQLLFFQVHKYIFFGHFVPIIIILAFCTIYCNFIICVILTQVNDICCILVRRQPPPWLLKNKKGISISDESKCLFFMLLFCYQHSLFFFRIQLGHIFSYFTIPMVFDSKHQGSGCEHEGGHDVVA